MKFPKELASEAAIALSPQQVFESLANSVILGVILMLITLWATNRVAKLSPADSKQAKKLGGSHAILMSASNVLYLCFGMTGVMLLVNNNLARAFAIGAAIALIRFRIVIDSTCLGMALFYAVLNGVACGVDQPLVGWGMTVFFGISQFAVLGYGGSVIDKPAPREEELPTAAAAEPAKS
jgi:hypothetical protein